MTKKYKLRKDTPDEKAGAIFEVPKFGRENWYISKNNSCFHAASVEGNAEWFEEVKEQERIEVTVYANETKKEYGKWFYTYFTDNEIPIDKFGYIKQAIEDVLNQEQEMTEALREGIKLKTAQFKGYKFEEGKLRVPQDIAERLRPLTPEYQQEKVSADTVVKDWEILAFKKKTENLDRYDTGSYIFRNPNDPQYDWALKDAIKNNTLLEIFTVKRLSDGEVFTLGDKVRYVPIDNSYGWVIDNFFVSDGVMLARGKDNEPVEDIRTIGKVIDEPQKLYTQQQLDKAIGDAFAAARHGQYGGRSVNFKYETFSDYKATLTNQ